MLARFRINIWMLATIILAVSLVAVVILRPNITGKFTGAMLTKDEAVKKCMDYINGNLVQPGTSANLVSIEELNNIYKITTSYQSNQIPVYITKDGQFLFLSAYNTSEILQQTAPAEPKEIPKTDKPTVQLFVMSFCPYGIQAENAMKPVVDLLGSKVTIETHYIVSISGNTVSSLHGDYEANEDMRQACIWEYYGQTTFWKYVDYLNNNCNKNNIDACWKDAAKNAGVDTAEIETCFTNEGLNLMKAEEALSNDNGVSGSPTLIINGVVYNGERTSEAYKQAICSGFATQPNECSQPLAAVTTASSSAGGCQ